MAMLPGITAVIAVGSGAFLAVYTLVNVLQARAATHRAERVLAAAAAIGALAAIGVLVSELARDDLAGLVAFGALIGLVAVGAPALPPSPVGPSPLANTGRFGNDRRMVPPARAPDRSSLGAGLEVPSALVVPLDGSDFAQRAVPVACRFALAFDAEIVAVTTPQTIDEPHSSTRRPGCTALTDSTPDVRIRTVVSAADDPAHAVAEVVARTEGAAVCMATHARGAIGSAALGNIAQRVLREVATPVLLVGRHCAIDDADHGPMVVAHDGSPAADAVLAPALAWAQRLRVPARARARVPPARRRERRAARRHGRVGAEPARSRRTSRDGHELVPGGCHPRPRARARCVGHRHQHPRPHRCGVGVDGEAWRRG